MKTQAEQIADLFDNDGLKFYLWDGTTIQDACQKEGARLQYPHNPDYGVYEFRDGSAVVVGTNAWDLRAPGCAEHYWEGAGCECAEKEESETT